MLSACSVVVRLVVCLAVGWHHHIIIVYFPYLAVYLMIFVEGREDDWGSQLAYVTGTGVAQALARRYER